MPKVLHAFTPLFAFARHLGRRPARQAIEKCQTLPGLHRLLGRVVAPELLAPEPEGDFSRQRDYDFATTVQAFLWQALNAQASCREAVMAVQE